MYEVKDGEKPMYGTLTLVQSASNRIDMKINAGTVDSTVTNTPILLMLSPRTVDDGSTFEAIFSELSEEWNKVYAYESVADAELKIYTEYWDIHKQLARIWIIMDSIPVTDKNFYITFDNSTAINILNELIGQSVDTSITDNYTNYVRSLLPIAYWTLDETFGTAAKDVSSTHSGVYSGSYTLGADELLVGEGGNSVDFIDGVVDITSHVTKAGSYSICMLVNQDNTAGTSAYNIMTFSQATSGMLFIYSNNFQLYNGAWHNTGVTRILEQTYHLVVNFDFNKTETTMYIDGVLVFTIGSLFGICDVSKIAESYNSVQNFAGRIDEPFVMPRMLTQTEITALYEKSI